MAHYDLASQTARSDRARAIASWDVRNRHPLTNHNRNHNQENTTMSAIVTVTGNLGQDPIVRYTGAGKPVTELSIAATASHKDRTTGQWVDDGEPLWIKAPFWGEEHTHLADALHKGDKVTVTGALVRRVFDRREGGHGESLEVKFPRFLGVIPRSPRTEPGVGTSAARPNAAGQWDAVGGGQPGDPWGTEPGF